jgi:hypothetical protein
MVSRDEQTQQPKADAGRCQACGGLPVLRFDVDGGVVVLCPPCAAAEGMGCP